MSQLTLGHRPPIVAKSVGGPQTKKPTGPAVGTKRKAPPQPEDDPVDDGNADVNAVQDHDGGNDGGQADDQQGQGQEHDGGQEQGGADDQPMDQPIQRAPRQTNNNNNRRPVANGNGNGRASGYAAPTAGNYRNKVRGAVQAPQGAPMQEDDEAGLPQLPAVLPNDPAEAKKIIDRVESQRRTEILRRKCQPSAPSKIDVNSRRAAPAIKLANLNPDLCGLDEKAVKSTEPGRALYFVTHTYAGRPREPTIQVEGRLTSTPMVSATFDTTNFSIELLDPVEQRAWSGMSRAFKRNFTRMAVEKKWPFACQMINKMVFRDFYLRGKITNEELRNKYADPDMLPADMVDPDTKQVIECYPPKIKAQLVMNKKNRNQIDTDVMDENDVQMNPFDLRRGNKVRMAIRMAYCYYKAQMGSQMPNEYGVPCKLAMIKRLDTQEETEGGPMKRTKWAEEDPVPVDQAPAQGQALVANAPAPAPTAVAPAPAPGATGGQEPVAKAGADALVESVMGKAGASLRETVRAQASLGAGTTASSSSTGSSTTAATTSADKKAETTAPVASSAPKPASGTVTPSTSASTTTAVATATVSDTAKAASPSTAAAKPANDKPKA